MSERTDLGAVAGLGWAALAGLPAVGVGVLLGVRHGVAWTAYAPNLAAAVLGCGLAVAAAFVPSATWRRAAPGLPLLALAMIGVATLSPGIDGVHRWLPLGPLRLNASATFAPWILVGFLGATERARTATVAAMVAAQALHVAQPDAAQATALALGGAPLLLDRSIVRPAVGWPASIAMFALAAIAWLRPDPLAPIDHVERALALAWSNGALFTFAAAVAVAALFVPFALPLAGRRAPRFRLAAALFLAASFASTFIGHFPVPVLGAGAGPVLGWFALVAVCVAAARAAREEDQAPAAASSNHVLR